MSKSKQSDTHLYIPPPWMVEMKRKRSQWIKAQQEQKEEDRAQSLEEYAEYFHSQESAFSVVDEHRKSDRHRAAYVPWYIWMVERCELEGKRQFLVSSRSTFCKLFQSTPSLQRHFYEMIREHSPCKLYLDIECYLTGDEDSGKIASAMALLEELLMAEFETVYRIQLQKEDILKLDSSTSEKFSQHWIVSSSKHCFSDNFNCGRFVRQWVHKIALLAFIHSTGEEFARIVRELETTLHERGGVNVKAVTDSLNAFRGIEASLGTSAGDLFIRKVVGGTDALPVVDIVPLIDLAVYTKNRSFRTYGSTKYGKTASFVFSSRDTPISEQDAIHLTSICNVAPSAVKLTCDDECVIPHKWACRDRLLGYLSGVAKYLEPSHSTRTFTRTGDHGRSSFSAIDRFISNKLPKGRVKGVREAGTFGDGPKSLIYLIEGYRYCHRLGREHKSNGIIYVVDLAKRVWYQKCLDPDCQALNYRSPPIAVPVDILPSVPQGDTQNVVAVAASRTRPLDFDDEFGEITSEDLLCLDAATKYRRKDAV